MKLASSIVIAVAAFAAPAMAQSPQVPKGLYWTQKDVEACAKSQAPCTIFTMEQIVEMQRAAFQAGYAKMARDLRDAMEAEHNKALAEEAQKRAERMRINQQR